jgi:hypothetical protein
VLIDGTTPALAAITREHLRAVTPQPPLAMSLGLYGEMDALAETGPFDLAGLYHDVLSMAGLYGGGGFRAGLSAVFYRALQDGAAKRWRFPVTLGATTHHLYAEVDAGDDGEPVITIFRAEDR